MSCRCRLLVVCLINLALPACGRLGFEEPTPAVVVQQPAADAGHDSSSAQDAATSSAADAATTTEHPTPPVDAGQVPVVDAAANSCVATTGAELCDALPQLPQRPVIDGTLECGLTLHTVQPLGWTGTAPIPSDHTGMRAAVGWHEQGIYFYIEVTDTSHIPATSDEDIWCDDTIEAFVDSDGLFPIAPAYDKPGAIQALSRVPAAANADTVAGGLRYRSGDLTTKQPWTTTEHAVYFRDTGYVFEAFLTAADLDLRSWTLRRGDRVGIDMAVDVSLSAAAVTAGQTGDCGTRAGQYFLSIAEQNCSAQNCLPYLNSAGFCTPRLE